MSAGSVSEAVANLRLAYDAFSAAALEGLTHREVIAVIDDAIATKSHTIRGTAGLRCALCAKHDEQMFCGLCAQARRHQPPFVMSRPHEDSTEKGSEERGS